MCPCVLSPPINQKMQWYLNDVNHYKLQDFLYSYNFFFSCSYSQDEGNHRTSITALSVRIYLSLLCFKALYLLGLHLIKVTCSCPQSIQWTYKVRVSSLTVQSTPQPYFSHLLSKLLHHTNMFIHHTDRKWQWDTKGLCVLIISSVPMVWFSCIRFSCLSFMFPVVPLKISSWWTLWSCLPWKTGLPTWLETFQVRMCIIKCIIGTETHPYLMLCFIPTKGIEIYLVVSVIFTGGQEKCLLNK